MVTHTRPAQSLAATTACCRRRDPRGCSVYWALGVCLSEGQRVAMRSEPNTPYIRLRKLRALPGPLAVSALLVWGSAKPRPRPMYGLGC